MNASALIQHLNIALVHIAAQSHICVKIDLVDQFIIVLLVLTITLYSNLFDCHIGIQYNDHHS